MKIRTRLFLSFLPALVGGLGLIAMLLCFSWRTEMAKSFQSRVETTLSATHDLLAAERRLQAPGKLSAEIHHLWEEFEAYRISEHGQTLFASETEPPGPWMISQHGTLVAEVDSSAIDRAFREQAGIVIVGALFLILISVASLYVIAGRISDPVQKLNNSALAMAAGHYGGSIQIKGPRELTELANTLNTMSECLIEHINRLKENVLLTERKQGEAECARLLQHLMLQKNIDECVSDAIAVKAITFSSLSPRGLLLDFPLSDKPEWIAIHAAQAGEEGFEGMYQLLTHYKRFKEHRQQRLPFSSLRLTLDRSNATLSAKGTGFAPPLIWNKNEIVELKEARPVDAGDFVFIYNRGLQTFFKETRQIRELLEKVLKYFAADGLEVCTGMLQKEIAFASKRKELDEDIHLLCFQILKPDLV